MNPENSGNIRKYILSNNNVICDVCGKKRKRSECVLAYGTGDIAVVMSCIDGCADYRHPLNSPPPLVFDGQPVLDARPDATEDSNSAQWFVNPFIPSYFTWGHFPRTGSWGHLNNNNSDFNTDPVWVWSAFTKG